MGGRYVLRKHAAIFRQLILAGNSSVGFQQGGSMSLVVGTIVWVVIGTAVLGLVVYAVDRSTARQERKD